VWRSPSVGSGAGVSGGVHWAAVVGAGPGVRAGSGVSGADGGRRAHRGGADRAHQAAAARRTATPLC
jgi:hypothetical protein